MTISTDDKDWLLQKIVNKVNGTDQKIPITLLVQGVFVSGNMVSMHHYLTYADKVLVEKDPETGILDMKNPPDADSVDMKNFSLGLTMTQAANQTIRNKAVWNEAPLYIHVEDAKFHDGTGKDIDKKQGVFWRGQIEKVSGFFLGFPPNAV